MIKLNTQQQQVVQHLQSPLFVLAGAGSGKTRVIIEKICYLIATAGYAPEQIVAVTFTNKAAREMRERLLERMPQAHHVTMSTFHTYGLNMLRQEYKAAHLKSQFTIFDDSDCSDLLRNLFSSKGKLGKDQVSQAQQKISQWKNAFISPEQAIARAQLPWEKTAAEIFANYQQHLRAYNAVDFDDLIVLPTQVLLEHEEVRQKWRQRVRYLLVDEYQDTNGSQYQLVKQLMHDRNGLMVVGDDDQSIYTWRGANPENLTALSRDFPSLSVHKLEQNYRSTMCILQAAHHVINHNQHVYDKNLWSDLGYGEKIHVVACADEQTEAEQVVAEIRAHRLRFKLALASYAILYRSNHQARVIEQVLRQQQVPYHMSGGLSFFSRTEIKDLLAYVRLLVNPDDDAAFLRVINTPRRGIGITSLEKIGSYASLRASSMYRVCNELGLQQEVTAPVWQRLQQVVSWFETIKQRAQADAVSAIYQLLKDIDYQGWLLSLYDSREQVQQRMSNIDELLQWLTGLLQGSKGNLADALNQLLLRDMQQQDDTQDAVAMMTIHAAKGLEFHHVTVVGVEEEILPHRNSIADDNIAEERRLFYVAMTRAERTLTLTYAKERKYQGKSYSTQGSRFLDELPRDHIVLQGQQDDTQTGGAPVKSHLAAMRELLGTKS